MGLQELVASIDKQWGKGTVQRLGGAGVIVPVETITTGSISFDIALGCGGFPRGRIIEIYGPEGSGKTTVALEIVARAQEQGLQCAYLDAEHALDRAYSEKIGVKSEELLLVQPDYGEMALQVVGQMAESGFVDVVVVDSVAALVPKAELDGEVGDAFVGVQARLMSQAMRKLTGVVAKSKVCLIFINQVRDKIGVMYGNPEVTTGGKALKFYASVRVDIRRIAQIKDGDMVVGSRTKVKIVKNKLAPPFREAEFDIIYGEGISHEGDLIDVGIECGLVEKSGSWYSCGGERIGQGRNAAIAWLASHKEISDGMSEQLRKRFFNG